MNDINTRLALSYYKEIGELSPEHDVSLVQNTQTRQVAVKKVLDVYSLPVYETLYKLSLPHIPRIELLYEENETLTVIEEYISGKTVAGLLAENGCFSEELIINYVLQLCGIAGRIHSLDPPVIHRDIKPSNIMITPSGELYLLDFNAAKTYTSGKTSDTVLLGTHGYAAPEQYGFGASEARTDIFAIGVLMNEMLTGTPAHECNADSPLAPIINRCTELLPEKRFQSAAELASALQAVSAGRPAERSTFSADNKRRPSLLPPGFRTGNPVHMAIALLGYALALYIAVTLQVQDATPVRLVLEKSTVFIIFIGVIFFTCNYQDVQRFVPFCQNRNPWVRRFAIVLVDVLYFFLVMFVLVIMENLTGMV